MDAIECRGVVQTFGTVRAVDNVSLSVPRGSVTALLGPNGAGKTTLVDVVLGLTRPRDGSVKLFGMTPRAAISRGYVGASQQALTVPDGVTVIGTLKALAALWPNPIAVADLIEWADLGGLAQRRVRKLSGGERQRLYLAMAMIPNPELLILDEPTTGMDVNARHRFWEAMGNLGDRTIVFATHYLEEAQNFAENIVIMDKGRVVASGSPKQIRARAQARLEADLPETGRDRIARELTASNPHWEIRFNPGGIEVRGSQLDGAARIILNCPGAENLTVVPASLDEAFTAITEG